MKKQEILKKGSGLDFGSSEDDNKEYHTDNEDENCEETVINLERKKKQDINKTSEINDLSNDEDKKKVEEKSTSDLSNIKDDGDPSSEESESEKLPERELLKKLMDRVQKLEKKSLKDREQIKNLEIENRNLKRFEKQKSDKKEEKNRKSVKRNLDKGM